MVGGNPSHVQLAEKYMVTESDDRALAKFHQPPWPKAELWHFLHQKDNASALYHDVYGGISPQADCGGVACGVSSRPVLQLCMPYVAKL